MHCEIDQEFMNHFRNLQQVFLYITDECNLRCAQCLYKPNLTFHLKESEIELEKAITLISDFREMGASKLSLLGGEPTLYGARESNQPLLMLINEAKELGYEYLRISTNGIFNSDLLLMDDFRRLDEISFSLDGPNSEINDPIRGKNTFDKCSSNIKKAVDLGYKVDMTCCVHGALLQQDEDGNLLIDSMIRFAASLGVRRINFHDLFKAGAPMDAWTGNLDPSVEEWIEMYQEVCRNIESGEYGISVRLPQCFVMREEFERNPEYYGYCPAKLGERALVHPNGIIRICSNFLSTPYGVARFFDNKIVWDRSPTNELRDHELNVLTPCTNRSKSKDFGNFVPLCFSFKPKQDEFIWKEKLKWEQRRKLQQVDVSLQLAKRGW